MTDSKHKLIIEAQVRDEVTRQMDKVQGSLKKTGQTAEREANRASAAWRTFAGVFGGITAAGLVRHFTALSTSSIRLASDAGELESAFRFTFEELSDGAQGFIDDLAKIGQRSGQDLKQALTDFQLLFEPLGFAREEALELSKAMVSLGVDISSLRNVDQGEVFQRFISGLTGQYEALRRLGITVSEETLRQSAYQRGITETNRQLTAQERVLVLVAEAYERSEKAIGDAERTADSFANRMKGAEAEIRDARIEIGEKLIEAIQNAIRDMGGWEEATNKIVGALEDVGTVAETVVGIVSSLAEAYDAVDQAFGRFQETRRQNAGPPPTRVQSQGYVPSPGLSEAFGDLQGQARARIAQELGGLIGGGLFPDVPGVGLGDFLGFDSVAQDAEQATGPLDRVRNLVTDIGNRLNELEPPPGEAGAVTRSIERHIGPITERRMQERFTNLLMTQTGPGMAAMEGVQRGLEMSAKAAYEYVTALREKEAAEESAARSAQEFADAQEQAAMRAAQVGQFAFDGLSQFLVDVSSRTKSTSEAFRDMVDQMIADFTRLLSQLLVGQLFQGLGIPFFGGLGFGLGGFGGGGSGFGAPAPFIPSSGSTPGTSGRALPFTGDGSDNAPRSGGNVYNINVSAVDAGSVAAMAQRNADTFAAAVVGVTRRNPNTRAAFGGDFETI